MSTCLEMAKRVQLAGDDGQPELVWAIGMSRSDIRKAMRVAEEQQAFLLERWREIHG